MKRHISLLLVIVMLFAILPHTAAADGGSPSVLRVGVSSLQEIFSPFFFQAGYDNDAVALTQVNLLGADRGGAPVTRGIEGEHRSFGGADYVYYGIADCDVTQNSDGTVDYLFRLRDDVLFADGEPLTVKDVLFSIYVLCDPAYDGGTTFYNLPIEGLEEYRQGSADSISGVTRIDDRSFRIHMTEFDLTALYLLCIPVAPMHYYGDASQYNGVDNFGFPKGDLSMIRAKNSEPMGAGPYVFESREDGVLTLSKNERYYRGEPRTDFIQFVEDASSAEKIGDGTVDLTVDSAFSLSTVSYLKYFNGDELSGDVITTVTTDFSGYGYIGINANCVKVGNDPGSDASRALRKAYATVFAAYREETVGSYYGDRAAVIEYPISSSSWAAPRAGDEGYETAFSKDAEGRAIYTEGMDTEARRAAALEAAVGFFRAAGFTWNGTVFTDVPALTASLSGRDHIAYGLFEKASEALATIGVTLDIDDSWFFDFDVPFWASAWMTSVDPDMYQIYHSPNPQDWTAGSSNDFNIADDRLDALITEGRSSFDFAYRKSIYKQCLDIIMDWAVEIPFYQRKGGAALFSTERIRIDTLTPDITAYWRWTNDIEKLTLTSDTSDPDPGPDPIVFKDVPADAYYAAPVAWAVEKGITNGTDPGKFSPEDTCTRGQIVTFLWRAKGCPEPKSASDPFGDVKTDDYYYKAVLWAVENGVTNGTSKTTFGPDEGCTRAQVVTFLWRSEGTPAPSSSKNPFRDVPAGEYYTSAVLWAVEQNITTGTDPGKFSPNDTCTRGQIVTFLYRDLEG